MRLEAISPDIARTKAFKADLLDDRGPPADPPGFGPNCKMAGCVILRLQIRHATGNFVALVLSVTGDNCYFAFVTRRN